MRGEISAAPPISGGGSAPIRSTGGPSTAASAAAVGGGAAAALLSRIARCSSASAASACSSDTVPLGSVCSLRTPSGGGRSVKGPLGPCAYSVALPPVSRFHAEAGLKGGGESERCAPMPSESRSEDGAPKRSSIVAQPPQRRQQRQLHFAPVRFSASSPLLILSFAMGLPLPEALLAGYDVHTNKPKQIDGCATTSL